MKGQIFRHDLYEISDKAFLKNWGIHVRTVYYYFVQWNLKIFVNKRTHFQFETQFSGSFNFSLWVVLKKLSIGIKMKFWKVISGVVEPNFYFFSAPAPPFFLISASAPAPAIYCHLKLFYNSSSSTIPMEVEISFSSYYSI